jgi:hypothetical protein
VLDDRGTDLGAGDVMVVVVPVVGVVMGAAEAERGSENEMEHDVDSRGRWGLRCPTAIDWERRRLETFDAVKTTTVARCELD